MAFEEGVDGTKRATAVCEFSLMPIWPEKVGIFGACHLSTGARGKSIKSRGNAEVANA